MLKCISVAVSICKISKIHKKYGASTYFKRNSLTFLELRHQYTASEVLQNISENSSSISLRHQNLSLFLYHSETTIHTHLKQ